MGREEADVYIHDSYLFVMLIVFVVLLHCLIHQVHCATRFCDPCSDVSELKLHTSS